MSTPRRILRVGLTGGVAAGKSTVSRLLADLGAIVVDADLLAREVVEPGTSGLTEIVAAFGPGVLDDAGALDRPALGARVFGDVEQRRVLEAIVHPRVRARAAEIEAAAPEGSVVVHDIPLLVETGQAAGFDAVIVVDVPVDVQVRRMVEERSMAEVDARARIAAQAGRADRRAAATHLIDNTGSLETLAADVAGIYAELARRAAGADEVSAGVSDEVSAEEPPP